MYVGQTTSNNVLTSKHCVDPKKPDDVDWTIFAVGDVLLHSPLQVQASKHKLQFRSLWMDVEDLIKQSDQAYANLEGPLGTGLIRNGKSVDDPGNVFDNYVYTSYPQFNYPDILAKNLLESGFDVVSTANNHALDRFSAGIDITINNLNNYGLAFTGTRKHEDETWHTVVQKNGLNIAWLACTYGTNGIPDKKHQVLNCFNDQNTIFNLIKDIHTNYKADGVIITPHWGNEYENQPSKQEQLLAKKFIESGALAIIGSHPHVAQPVVIEKDTNGVSHLVAYSLGNFVSGQRKRLSTRGGIGLEIGLIKKNNKLIINAYRVIGMEMKNNPEWSINIICDQEKSELKNHLNKISGAGNDWININ